MPFPVEFFDGRAFQPFEKTEQAQRWKRVSDPVGILLWKERDCPFWCSVVIQGITIKHSCGTDPHKLVSEALSFAFEAQKGFGKLLTEGPPQENGGF